MTRNEVGPLNASVLGYIYLFLAIAIFAAFFFLFGHTSLWYDEANYLVIASAIKETGYPIWLGDPDTPAMMLSSPPGFLYLISIFSKYVTNDLFLLRLINSFVFLVIAFLALFIYIRKKGMDFILLSLTALFCAFTYYFIVELVQVRMDLPLAALSFLVLVIAALAEFELKERSERKLKALANRRLFVTLALLVGVSGLAFLTKFQAVCLTACLFLNVVLCQDFRRLASWLPLSAHIAGAVIGILVLVILLLSNPLVPIAAILHDNVAYDLWRVAGPQFSLLIHAVNVFAVCKGIFPMVIVPAIIFGVAKATKGTDWDGDQLFRLSVLMVAVVVAFNIVVHRMPGAGGYYMIQAAIPLGYIAARSFKSLFHAHRRWQVLILTSVLTFHAILNVPFGGGDDPQRWDNRLKDLVGHNGRLDASKVVAANVAPSLRYEELLLVDGPQYQSRVIPYWLNRADRYGYLFTMDPIRAESLLVQEGPRRVGALVFLGEASLAMLRSKKWSGVEALLVRDFVRSTPVENPPGWTVYRRRTD